MTYSFLRDLTEMPENLQGLYQARSDWERTLSNFRAHRNVWKASVLNGVEDEETANLAEACWQQLRAVKQKLTKLHRQLGFSKAENESFQLPWEEYREEIAPEVEAPPEPARMPDDIKKMLVSVLDSWSNND